MIRQTFGPRAAAGLLALFALQGCASMNRTEEGAAAGAVLGGVVGGLLDDHTARGAILGAVIGGTAGAIIGRQMDRQAAELERELEGAEVERVGEGIQVTFESGLLFDFDSDALRQAARSDLSDLSGSLQEYDNTDLVIVGHTDATGPDSYNLDLSRRRAESAARHLTSEGVSRDRMRIEGRGESEPVATNDTEAGRQENRRVEVAIFASEEYRQALLDAGETGEAQQGSGPLSRLSLEVRGGLNRPLGDFRDAGGRGDASFGADLFFDVTPDLALYAGWGRDQFSCEGCDEGEGIDAQGFEAGGQYTFPTGAALRPWIRAGATYYEVETELGSTTTSIDGELGFQGALGVIFPLGDVISVSPAVRYQRWSPDGAPGDGSLSYVSGEVGLRLRIPPPR